MKVAVTGHRPPKIGGYNPESPLRKSVRESIKSTFLAMHSVQHISLVITGGALGVDQDTALICIELGLDYCVAIPCLNHDSKWPEHSKKLYKHILSKAYYIQLVSDTPYDNLCMQKRNEWMVDQSDMLIGVWNGTKGGTANCIRYAKEKGKSIKIINPNTLLTYGETSK